MSIATSPHADHIAPCAHQSAFGTGTGHSSRDPRPRGPLSAWCLERFAGDARRPAPSADNAEPFGDDAQLAMYLCHEVHYGDPTFDHVDEWDPEIHRLRLALDALLERSLRTVVERDLHDDAPSLSHAASDATIDQLAELVTQRSLYHRREADQHTLAIPHLRGRAKHLYAEIQAGEYGADAPGRRMHSDLYATTMTELGLDPTLNAYLDEADAAALLLCNTMSLFGSNRRLRGAAVGHLAAFECTSVEPMGRYVDAFRSAGASDAALRFYEVHVLADAHHEKVALDLLAAFAEEFPAETDEVTFGARSALWVEGQFARAILNRWDGSSRTRPQQPSRAANSTP